MADHTLIIAVTGIAVSGVVGPAMTAWATRVSDRRQFIRDREGHRRDEMLVLFDEAASLLALGPVRLRQIMESHRDGSDLTEEMRVWPEQVYALGPRLRLRLGANHDVVTAFGTVRVRLIEAGELRRDDPDGQAHENAVLRFEASRADFLDAAQRALRAPIKDKEAQP